MRELAHQLRLFEQRGPVGGPVGERVFEWLYLDLRDAVGGVPSHERDDVLHDAIADMLRKMSTHAPRDPTRFRGWALSYVCMQVSSSRRQRTRTLGNRAKAARLLGPLIDQTTFATRLERVRLFRLALELLDQLSARYQRVVRHMLEDEGDQSLADELGLLRTTVRSQRSRAYEQLRALAALVLQLAEDESSPSPAG